MHIATLSSSSTRGNAYLAWDDNSRPILIDCGISIRRLVRGLDHLGMKPQDIGALFVTHEHSDHISAMCLVTPVAERFRIPVYSSPGFWSWYHHRVERHIDSALIRVIRPGDTVSVGRMSVRAFAKPHDAVEPLAFTVESGGQRAAFVTDLGYVPEEICRGMAGSDYVVFESNHDVEMEKRSGRPIYLIRRVLATWATCLTSRPASPGTPGHQEHPPSCARTPEHRLQYPGFACRAVVDRLLQEGKRCSVAVAPPGDVAVFH